MTIKEAKLIGMLMRATEKHKGTRSRGGVGRNIPCDCNECHFIAYIWTNFLYLEDLYL